MNLLQAIRSFVRTVETGSIAAAGRNLGISAAAVSQNIARLEAHLGIRLLNRSTRSLALTERGQIYFEQVRQVEADLERARHSVTDQLAEPEGRLRVATTAAFGRHLLAPMLPSLRRKHPRLEIELIVSDRSVSHALEDVDASIRIPPQLEDGLVARCIARIPFVLCAAPDYLARAGRPTRPEQLLDHDCLLFRYPVDGRCLRWRFMRHGRVTEPALRPAMVSNDIDALAGMAAAGGGITRLAAFVAQPWLERGDLVDIGTDDMGFDAVLEPMQVYLCVSDRRDLTPKLRAFATHVRERLPPPWRQPDDTALSV